MVIGKPCQILNYENLFILTNNNKIFIIHIYYIFKLKNTLISKYKLFFKKWHYIGDLNNNRLVYIEINIIMLLYWYKNTFYLNIFINYNRLKKIIYKI